MIDIDASLDLVWTALTDLQENARWSAEDSDPVPGVGSSIEWYRGYAHRGKNPGAAWKPGDVQKLR